MCSVGGTVEEDGLIIGISGGQLLCVYTLYVCRSVVVDGGMLVSQMSQLRGGQHGRGEGGGRAVVAVERGGGMSISSRPGNRRSSLGSEGVL